MLSRQSNSQRAKCNLAPRTQKSELLETTSKSNCPEIRNYVSFFCLLRSGFKSSLLSTYRFLSVIIVLLLGLNNYVQKVSAQALLPYTPELTSEYLDPYGAELLQDAVQLIRFREFELALSRAKLASQLSPNHYETWFILGTLYIQQGKIEEGVNALQKSKELAPEEAEVLFALGNSYFQLGDYDNAAKELQAGLKINPEVPQAYFDLGNSYLKLSQYQKAIAAYEQAVKLEEAFWPAINNIGLIEYEQGKRSSAIKKWRKALTIDEQQAEPTLAIAVALYTEGKETEGIKLGKQALELDNSYGDLEFLEENLWGKKLLSDTAKFFQAPAIKVMIKTEAETNSTPE